MTIVEERLMVKVWALHDELERMTIEEQARHPEEALDLG